MPLCLLQIQILRLPQTHDHLSAAPAEVRREWLILYSTCNAMVKLEVSVRTFPFTVLFF